MSSLKDRWGKTADAHRFPIQRPMTLDGTPTGSADMAVDGSITPVEFYVKPQPNRIVQINRIGIIVSDAGNANEDDYGSITGPLTNGMVPFWINDGIEIPLTPVLKRTIDFFGIGADANFVTLSGTSRIASYSFNFLEYSEGFVLDGDRDDRFGFRVRDDMSGLTVHEGAINGNFTVKQVP